MANANIKAVITAEDKASATLKGFGNNVDDVGKKMSGAFKTAALAAGALAATGIGAAVKASYDQVDAVQQATIALKAYEKDSNKVSKTLGELVGFARSDMGVLFNRKDLFAAAQQLKIMGDNTESLTAHTKIMARSVGLGLSTFEGLGNVIGRVGATGRLYADDLQYLQNAGFKLDNSLSGTHQTFDSLFKLLDQGIPEEALAGQSETIRGQMVRLQTAFRNVGDAILGVNKDTGQFIEGGLGSKMVDGINRTTNALKGLAVFITNFRGTVSEAFASLSNTINTFLGPSLRALVQTIADRLVPALVHLYNSLEPALTQVIKVVAAIIAGLLVANIWVWVNAMNVVISVVGGVISIISNLIGWVGNLAGTFVNVAGSIIRAMGGIASGVRNGIQSALDAVWGFFGRFVDAGWGLMRALADGIKGAASVPYNAAKGAVQKIKDLLPGSDAKEGPLKNLTKSGVAFSETFAAGINKGSSAVQQAASGALAMPDYGLSGSNSYSTPNTVSSPTKTTTTPNVNITVQAGAYMGSQQDARKYAQMIMNAWNDLQASRGMA